MAFTRACEEKGMGSLGGDIGLQAAFFTTLWGEMPEGTKSVPGRRNTPPRWCFKHIVRTFHDPVRKKASSAGRGVTGRGYWLASCLFHDPVGRKAKGHEKRAREEKPSPLVF